MKTILLSEYSGPEALTLCALTFASERLEMGAKIAARIDEPGTGNNARARRKIAIRALQESRVQLKAAIALLECGL